MPRSKLSRFEASSIDASAIEKSDDCQSKTSDSSSFIKSQPELEGLHTRSGKLISKLPAESKTAPMIQPTESVEDRLNDENNEESVVMLAPVKNAEDGINQSLPPNDFVSPPTQCKSNNPPETAIQTDPNVNSLNDVFDRLKAEIGEKILELTSKIENESQRIETAHIGLSNFKLSIKNDFSVLKESIDKNIEKMNQMEEKFESDFRKLTKDSEERFVTEIKTQRQKIGQELLQNIKLEFQTSLMMVEQRFQNMEKNIENKMLDLNQKISSNEAFTEEINNLSSSQKILIEKIDKNNFSSVIHQLNNKFDSLAVESNGLKQNHLKVASALTMQSSNLSQFFKKVEELIDLNKNIFSDKERKLPEKNSEKDEIIQKLKIELSASEKVLSAFQLENSAVRSQTLAQRQLDEARSERIHLQNKIDLKKKNLVEDATSSDKALKSSETKHISVEKESKSDKKFTNKEKDTKKDSASSIVDLNISEQKKKSTKKNEGSTNEKIQAEEIAAKKQCKSNASIMPQKRKANKPLKEDSEKTNEKCSDNDHKSKKEKNDSNINSHGYLKPKSVPDSRATEKSSKQSEKNDFVTPSKNEKKWKANIKKLNHSESTDSTNSLKTMKRLKNKTYPKESDEIKIYSENEKERSKEEEASKKSNGATGNGKQSDKKRKRKEKEHFQNI